MPMTTEPAVEVFSAEQGAGQKEHRRRRDGERESQSDESHGPGGLEDTTLDGEDVNCLLEISWRCPVFEGVVLEESWSRPFEPAEPIESLQKTDATPTELAVVVEDHQVRGCRHRGQA